jgi:hypothetical protein
MKIYISLVIAMGLTRKPDLESYWSTDPTISIPFFGSKMAKDRFMAMLSNLHLVDNDNHPAGRLYKVNPFIHMMRRTFDVYSPEETLSFDEGSCPFKGRVKFRVYNPNKPHKFGIKLYQVCEASSGYCLGFDIYTGEEGCELFSEAVDLDVDSTKTVVGLLACCGLLSKGHKIYMDNYYTSPELFIALDFLETYACGTLRRNRKLVPKAFEQIKLRKGDAIFRRMDNLLALKFKDKRDVHMLSSFHEAKIVITDKTDRNGEPVWKPAMNVAYCKNVGGVDLNDQICQYYDVLRKSVKWWKTLFFHHLNMVIVNAYVFYRKYGNAGKRRTHQNFRGALIRALIEESADAPTLHRGRGRKGESLPRLTERHFPAFNIYLLILSTYTPQSDMLTVELQLLVVFLL